MEQVSGRSHNRSWKRRGEGAPVVHGGGETIATVSELGNPLLRVAANDYSGDAGEVCCGTTCQ